MHITTIELSDGVAKIDQEKFQAYLREAFEHLSTLEEAQGNFKEVVEVVSTNTGVKKGKISKYFKERFGATTKKTKELGQLFESLDEIVEA